MRPVNLMAPEDRRGEHAPLRAGLLSYALVGFLAVALVGVTLMVLAGNDVSEKQAELAALEVRKAQADAAAADYAEYESFASLELSRSETVSSLAETRFDWERVLSELSLVIPQRVTIDSLSGTVSADVAVGGGDATASASGIAGPSLQISGCARGQNGTARFLASLRDIDGVTRVGMQSSALGEDTEPGAPSAAASDSAGGVQSEDCQVSSKVARFQVTVAFDAVPVPAVAAPPAEATPASATTDQSGVAETQAEQQDAKDSAGEQVSEAAESAETVGGDAQ